MPVFFFFILFFVVFFFLILIDYINKRDRSIENRNVFISNLKINYVSAIVDVTITNFIHGFLIAFKNCIMITDDATFTN